MLAKPFEGVLGNNCELRLLQFLIPLEDVKFNISELADESGVSRVTTGKVAKKFVEWNILKAHKGRNTEYSINLESPLVKCIINFNNVLVEEILDEEELFEINDFIIGKRHELFEENISNGIIKLESIDGVGEREIFSYLQNFEETYGLKELDKGRIPYNIQTMESAG